MGRKKKEVFDEETRKVNTVNEELIAMSKSTGWDIARKSLYKKVAGLLTLDTEIMNMGAAGIIEAIASRKLAADILVEWIKGIEGQIDGAKGNKPLLDQITEDFIIRDLE